MAMGRKNVEYAIECIGARSGFTAASMRGERRITQRCVFSTGKMPESLRARFLADAPTYVVWSYGTPIGWVSADNRKVVPAHKYSVTTSNHQGIVRQAFGTYVE